MGRSYHLLGLFHLSAEFSARVLAEATAWRAWMEENEEKAGPVAQVCGRECDEYAHAVPSTPQMATLRLPPNTGWLQRGIVFLLSR